MRFKLTDCTFRDGGYHTNWEFDKSLVSDTISVLDVCGITIVELGYKSPKDGGEYRKCDDGYLKSFLKSSSEFRFMVDVKDFVSNGRLDIAKIHTTIKERDFFQRCRIALRQGQLDFSLDMCRLMIEKGYIVDISLMDTKSFCEDILKEYISVLSSVIGDGIIYFSDSYSTMFPEDVRKIVGFFKELNIQEIGFHSHNGLGLSLANSLEAVKNGVKYLDATVSGMGRASGNLVMEEILAFSDCELSLKCLKLSESRYHDLKSSKSWGPKIEYLIGSLKKESPLVVQNISRANNKSSASIEDLLYGKSVVNPYQ